VHDVDDLIDQYVAPYYLDMMGLNAVVEGREHLASIRAAGQSMPVETVIRFLRSDWRPRVMGAWYSLRQEPAAVAAVLLRSLETSVGSLTAPALATAACVMVGADAVTSLETYAAVDVASQYGSAGFVAAAVEHLGVTPTQASATGDDRENLAKMLKVAATLREE
jgi:hypothetical protein